MSDEAFDKVAKAVRGFPGADNYGPILEQASKVEGYVGESWKKLFNMLTFDPEQAEDEQFRQAQTEGAERILTLMSKARAIARRGPQIPPSLLAMAKN